MGAGLTRFVMLGLVCAGGALADRAALAADPKLVAAAEQEGQLALYNCDISESPIQVKRFSELYPKIKVTTYVASCWQTYNRHVSERAAGRPIADAFISTDDVFMKMNDEGLLQSYDSPELAHFPAGTRPANANYLRYKALLAAFTINPEQMKGVPIPQDWTDFANPPAQWKDKISFYDPRTSSLAFTVLATLHQQLGAEGARKIYAGLKSANAELSSSTPAGTQKLLSGEKPIMFYILTNQYGATVAKGAPLVFNVPKSGAIGTHFGVATLNGAPHPNAAKLWADFILSDGQKVVSERAEYALRNDASAPKGMPPLKSVKIMPTDFRKALADQKSLIGFWQEATGIR
jgi:iron(III) transport system substrate-binding protein